MRKIVATIKHNMFISMFAIPSDLQPCDQASWEAPEESIHFGVPCESISGNRGSKIKPFNIVFIFKGKLRDVKSGQ